MKLGRSARGAPACVERQAYERPRQAPEIALERYGRLNQFPAPTEVAERSDRVPLRRPWSAVPLRREKQKSSVFGHAAHLDQRRLRIGDVLEDPDRPCAIELVCVQRKESSRTEHKPLMGETLCG